MTQAETTQCRNDSGPKRLRAEMTRNTLLFIHGVSGLLRLERHEEEILIFLASALGRIF